MAAEESCTEEQEEQRDGWKKGWNREKTLRIIVILGIAGIGLIFLSSLLKPAGRTEETAAEALSEFDCAREYQQALCEELGNMIASIDGAGKTKIMLTLEGTIRNLYATDQDIQSSENRKPGEKGEDLSTQNNEKKSCIVVRRSDGSEQALLIGQLMPKVSGVMIVCEGGDKASVRETVTAAAASALGIPKSHICVLKMNS